jgi:hypothetical protein
MSAPLPFQVRVTKTTTYAVTVEASTQDEAIATAQELYDVDNSGFTYHSHGEDAWEAEPLRGDMEPSAALNDLLRTTFMFGRVVITEGIGELPPEDRSRVVEAVQTFSAFTRDNNPHGERDFGAIDLPGIERVFWKIDYYDPTLRKGSEDPSDPRATTRVLTIMLASEY